MTADENVRGNLLRELCEQINLWDQDAAIEDEDGLAEHWLMPVIDRYLDAARAEAARTALHDAAEETRQMRDPSVPSKGDPFGRAWNMALDLAADKLRDRAAAIPEETT